MSTYESSSDRPENNGELSRPTDRRYTGPLPDLTIGDRKTDNSPDAPTAGSDTQGGHQDLKEPSVKPRDIGASEVVSAHVPKATDKIGETATHTTVEIPEPSVASRRKQPADTDATNATADTSQHLADEGPRDVFRLYTEEVVEERPLTPAEQYYSNADRTTDTKAEGDDPKDASPSEKEGSDAWRKEFMKADKVGVDLGKDPDLLRRQHAEHLGHNATNTNAPSSDNAPDATFAKGTGMDVPFSKQARVDLGTDEAQGVFDKYAAEGFDQATKAVKTPQEPLPQPPTIDTVAAMAAEAVRKHSAPQTPDEPIGETVSHMPLGGLLEHDVVAKPFDVVAEPDNTQPTAKFRIPTDVITEAGATRPHEFNTSREHAGETAATQDKPVATEAEVLSTDAMIHQGLIPSRTLRGLPPPLPETAEPAPSRPLSTKAVIPGEVVAEGDSEAGVSMATNEGAAAPKAGPEAISTDELANIAPGTIIIGGTGSGKHSLDDVHGADGPDAPAEIPAPEANTLHTETGPTAVTTDADDANHVDEAGAAVPEATEPPAAAPEDEATELDPTVPEATEADAPTVEPTADKATAAPEAPMTETPTTGAEPTGDNPASSTTETGTEVNTPPARPSGEGTDTRSTSQPADSSRPWESYEDNSREFPIDPAQPQNPHNTTQASADPDPNRANTAPNPNQKQQQATGQRHQVDPHDEVPDNEGKFSRAWHTFNGTYKPQREDAKDGILGPNEVYAYARPTPRERVAAAGVLMGTAAISPIRTVLAKVEGVERTGLGRYTVKITRGGRTKLIEVAAPGAGMARIMARIKSAFS